MRFLLAFLICLMVTPAFAAEKNKAKKKAPREDVTVAHAYTYPSIDMLPATVVFMKINNHSKKNADTLLSVTTDAADKAVFEEFANNEHNVMQITHPASIDIPVRHATLLTPEGKHVTLTGLKNKLKLGDKFNITLNFQRKGALVVPVTVVPMGSQPGMTTTDMMQVMQERKGKKHRNKTEKTPE